MYDEGMKLYNMVMFYVVVYKFCMICVHIVHIWYINSWNII
jgi:hypothetical protein